MVVRLSHACRNHVFVFLHFRILLLGYARPLAFHVCLYSPTRGFNATCKDYDSVNHQSRRSTTTTGLRVGGQTMTMPGGEGRSDAGDLQVETSLRHPPMCCGYLTGCVSRSAGSPDTHSQAGSYDCITTLSQLEHSTLGSEEGRLPDGLHTTGGAPGAHGLQGKCRVARSALQHQPRWPSRPVQTVPSCALKLSDERRRCQRGGATRALAGEVQSWSS